jgi:hypothetical protein
MRLSFRKRARRPPRASRGGRRARFRNDRRIHTRAKPRQSKDAMDNQRLDEESVKELRSSFYGWLDRRHGVDNVIGSRKIEAYDSFDQVFWEYLQSDRVPVIQYGNLVERWYTEHSRISDAYLQLPTTYLTWLTIHAFKNKSHPASASGWKALSSLSAPLSAASARLSGDEAHRDAHQLKAHLNSIASIAASHSTYGMTTELRSIEQNTRQSFGQWVFMGFACAMGSLAAELIQKIPWPS